MISEDLVKQVWKKIDDLVDWRKITGRPMLGNILELSDNILGPAGLKYLNEKFGDKIPVDLMPSVNSMFEAFINDDYEGVKKAIPEGVDQIIDIKQIPDDIEAAWIAATFNALVAVVKYYASQKK